MNFRSVTENTLHDAFSLQGMEANKTTSFFNSRVRNLQFAKNGVKYCEIYLTGTQSHTTRTHTHYTHTHSLHTHTLTLSHTATLVALYEFIMNTDRTCCSSSAATTFFALRQRRFSTVFYLFNISFLYFSLLFGVCFGMTLTLS